MNICSSSYLRQFCSICMDLILEITSHILTIQNFKVNAVKQLFLFVSSDIFICM